MKIILAAMLLAFWGQASAQDVVTFAEQCADDGVLMCEGFENAADIPNWTRNSCFDSSGYGSGKPYPNDGEPTYSTAFARDGTGSVRFRFNPAQPNCTSGAYWRDIPGGPYGPGTVFYYQYSYYEDFDPQTAFFGGDGPKLSIAYGNAGTCRNDQHVIQHSQHRGYLNNYAACNSEPLRCYDSPIPGGGQTSQHCNVTLNSGSNYFQYYDGGDSTAKNEGFFWTGTPEPGQSLCRFNSQGLVQQGDGSCHTLQGGVWNTVTGMVRFGNWDQRNTDVWAWMGVDGPQTNMKLASEVRIRTQSGSQGFTRVELQRFTTGRSVGQGPPVGQGDTYYDNFILSTKCIMDPRTGTYPEPCLDPPASSPTPPVPTITNLQCAAGTPPNYNCTLEWTP